QKDSNGSGALVTLKHSFLQCVSRQVCKITAKGLKTVLALLVTLKHSSLQCVSRSRANRPQKEPQNSRKIAAKWIGRILRIMPNFGRNPFVALWWRLNTRLYNALACQKRGLLLATGNASGAYQGRNPGPRRGVTGERLREGCPFAFACEARSSRTGPGLIG